MEQSINTLAENYERVTTAFNRKNNIPILHIIKSLGRGGAETLLPETLSKHDKEKFQFHYIYFLPWKYHMVQAIKDEGGIVTCLSSKDNVQIMLKLGKIIRYIKQHKIQLIHCHMPWAGILGRIAGAVTGVPVVYTEHNKWERYHKLTYFLNKLSFGNQKKVIAVSADVADSIKMHFHKSKPQVQVVMNGINTDKFSNLLPVDRDIRKELNIADNTIVFGITCVFRTQKRLGIWLDIANKIHAAHPNTYFIIVGDGTLKEEILKKSELLGMEHFLHFAGLQSEIRPFLKAMDIFMMTSEFEGLPIALLEAMSMECMPACTAAGGISELIKHKINGVLVPVDSPSQLADSLSDYLNDPVQIKKMGRAARETVMKSFGLQNMVDELETIYSESIN